MRYRVNWLKDGKAHHLLIRETTPGGALKFAWTLLVETRPSDIWIATEGGRRVANYADVVEEGPMLAAPPPPNALDLATGDTPLPDRPPRGKVNDILI